MRPVPLDMLPPELQGGTSQFTPVPLDMLPPELGGAEPPKPAQDGFLRQAADIPLGIAKGAVSGVGMLADLFGADTAAAKSIQNAEGYLNSLMSAQAKNDQQEIARIMKDAEGKGMGEEVKAALRAFTTAPVDFLSQAAGTVAPALLAAVGAKVLGAGALIATATGAGVGAGMGAGVVKGTIYDETKKALLDAGMSEAQAEARASLAQSYGGENLDMILGGAALGGLAATTGVEKALIGPISRRILGKTAAKEAGATAATGAARRIAGTAITEAVPEFAQAAQEKIAANLALQREGMDRDLMAGVVGAGALEALAGAGLGAGVGAFTRPTPAAPTPTPTPTVEPVVPVPPEALPEELAAPAVEAAPVVEPEVAPAVTPATPVAAAAPQPAVAPVAPVEPTPPMEAAPEMIPGRPVEQPPLPMTAEQARSQADYEAAIKEYKRAEREKSAVSLGSILRNQLDPREVKDIGKDKNVYNWLTKKEGGKFLDEFVTGGQLNEFIPPDLWIMPDDDATIAGDKESQAIEIIKDKLRNQNYLTFETEQRLREIDLTLDRIGEELSQERSLEEQRTEINDLLAEINAELERELPPEDLVEAAPEVAERDLGEPVSPTRPAELRAEEPELETGAIVSQAPLPEGMETRVFKTSDGYGAGLYDADAGQFVNGSIRRYNGADSQGQAQAYADTIGSQAIAPSAGAMRVSEPSPEDRRRADLERDLFRLTPEEGQFAPTTGVQGDLFGATGLLAPTPQLQRRKNSNTEQLSLFLESDPDPSQPGSEQARLAAAQAVEQLQESDNPMAMTLADDLAQRQATLLVGKQARSPDDMAFLAQVYRDNRFETFRVFFTDKNSQIISQLGLTSRLPGSAVATLGGDAYFDSVADVAKQKGATGYFIVHNHPSGVVEASAADRVLSREYAQRFSALEYKGHVIIDTNKYSVIKADGTTEQFSKDFGAKPFPGQTGEFGKVFGPADAAAIAKQLETSDGDITLLVLNIRGNVMQVSTIPASVAQDGNKPRLRRNLQKLVLKARGANLIVVGKDRNKLAPFIGLAQDAIYISPNGSVESTFINRANIIPQDRRGRVAAATSPEFNYLKDPERRSTPEIQAREVAGEDNPGTYGLRQNIFGKTVDASWGRHEESKLDTFIHNLQDKMVDVKRVQQQIRNSGKEIADRWNAYLKEELFHGRAAKKTKDFLLDELDPLMKEMGKRNVNMAEFEEYLHNRTAETRNKLVAQRDPENYPDGGSGISTEDANKYLDGLDPKKKADFEALAKMVDKITKGTRNLLVQSGHESPDTIAAWEKALPFYVPLNRVEADYELSKMGTGVGQGFAVRGAFARGVVGSEKAVVDILANIAMQRERAIVRTEKMRVGQALYGLILQNPNPNFWLAVDPEATATPKGIEKVTRMLIDGLKFPPFDPNVQSLQQLMQAIMKEPTIRKVDPSTNEVISASNAALRDSPYVLPVRINGTDKYIFFNPQDPIAKRMAESLRNVDADQMDKVLGPIGKITRYFAAINTQYNPIFGVINFLRDVQGALIQLTSTPLNGKQKQVMSGTMPALRGIYEDLRARREGRRAEGEWADLWNQFQDLGGQTGFRDQFSRSEERADALYSVMNPSSWTETKLGKVFTVDGRLKVPLEAARKSVAKPLFDWLSDYNETMENAIRLSAFKTGLDSGLSPEQAASVAKNLTVNFNRKGLIGKQAGALYAFFNASVQGTARMASTLFTKQDGRFVLSKMGQRIFYGGLLLGSAQAMLLAAAGFDEEEPPEFIKERNIVIPVGGGKYVTIPMPLGYNVIPNTSRVMTEWAMSGFKDTSKRVAQITGALLEMFNPIGNAGWSWQTFSPTIADPAVAIFENRDWTGKPIAKEDFSSLDPSPGYTRARETASWFSKNLSEFLNRASGGTEFKKGLFSPTPDQIDYLIGQLTGGVGRELLKAEQTVTSAVTGEELPTYKIPLVGRFVGDTTGQAAVGNKFYANLTELNGHQREIEGRRKAGQEVQSYIRDNPESRLYKMADRIQRNVSRLRKRRAEMLERGATKEQIRAIENQITVQMQRLNDAVDRLKE